MAVLVIDSGSGGISILEALVANCAQHDFIFVADTMGFPYGGRSEEFVTDRVMDCIAKIEKLETQFDAIIVACNTASTIVLPSLRQAYDCSVIGVVPAIKTAANLTKTNHIGLLATVATVERSYTQKLIEDYAAHCKVTKLGSHCLVHLAEEFIATGQCDFNALKRELETIIEAEQLDSLVLGCTHYPLLYDEIRAILPDSIEHIVDSGLAIARRLNTLIPDSRDNAPVLKSKDPEVHFYFSKEDHVAIGIQSYLSKKFTLKSQQIL